MSSSPRYLRPSLRSALRYTPGEPASDGWLRLNTNEAPLPPSRAVVAAVAAAATDLRHYPHPRAEPLRTAIADHHGVSPEQVLVAAGADGLLSACFRAFCEPGSTVSVCDPTYPVLHDLARLYSTTTTSDASRVNGAAVTFVVNPSVPSGRWVEPTVLAQELVQREGVVVIDEVYAPFSPGSVIPHLAGHPNWLAIRSFSKGYGLAGLRVGYAIGSRELVGDLAVAVEPYPVSSMAIAGAVAALGDASHHDYVIDLVRHERERLASALRDRGWDVPPSEGNFVFARPPDGEVDHYVDGLRERRVLVRTFPLLDAERVRITIGTEADNDRLLTDLGSVASSAARRRGTTDPRIRSGSRRDSRGRP